MPPKLAPGPNRPATTATTATPTAATAPRTANTPIAPSPRPGPAIRTSVPAPVPGVALEVYGSSSTRSSATTAARRPISKQVILPKGTKRVPPPAPAIPAPAPQPHNPHLNTLQRVMPATAGQTAQNQNRNRPVQAAAGSEMEQLQQQVNLMQAQHNQLYAAVQRLLEHQERQQTEGGPVPPLLAPLPMLPQYPPHYPPQYHQNQQNQPPPGQQALPPPPPQVGAPLRPGQAPLLPAPPAPPTPGHAGYAYHHEHRLRVHAQEKQAQSAQSGQPNRPRPQQLQQEPGVPPPPPSHTFEGPPCGPPPPCWIFPSIEAATEAIKAHALANGYTLVLRSRIPAGDDATVYNFRCGRGGHRRQAPIPDRTAPDGTPIKHRNRPTQKTGCHFTTTVKRDKYAPAPGQVWRVSPPHHLSQPHNHPAMDPLSFSSERGRILEAYKDSILLMHNDGIRVGKIRKYLKLDAIPKSDLYNLVRKYTKQSRENLMAVQRQQQAELQNIAGQLGQIMPAGMGSVPQSLLRSNVEDLTDEGQLRKLMEADRDGGEEDDVMEDDDDDDEELDDPTADVMEDEESEEE